MRPSTLEYCLVLVTLASSLVPPAFAQPPAPPAAATPAAPYAGESIVIEHLDTVFTFAADATGSRVQTIAARIQSDAAVRSLGVISIPYAGNSEQVDILYARVRRPDGTVVDSDTTAALDMPQPVTRDAPFYSDLKEKQLPIRSLRVGDALEWKARITRTKAEAPGNFWGQQTFTGEGALVLSETFELSVPAGLYVNVWSPTAKPTETTEAGQHIYRWTSSQLKPTAGKEAEAAAEAKKKLLWTADQELDAEEGKLPSIAWTTFKSWEDVGAWYRTLEADRVTPVPEVKAKAAELIAGKSTDEEKVRSLYGYVATQIRYIGVDFGVGRYQPHTAAEILTNQYGDCKDKHTLLAAMLSATGINSDAVLIGAGIRFNPEVPSPAAFNHLITHLTVAGQPVWLDATAEIAPYRMLNAVIRDESALVVPPAGPAHIDRTPADPPFPSTNVWKTVGALDKEGVSTSRITYATRGDEELLVRALLRQIAPAQYAEVIQGLSQAMGYQGTATHPDFSSPTDTLQPLTWSYDYRREQGGDWDHLKIIPQTKYNTLPIMDEKEPPIQSIDLGWPRTEFSTAEMKLPEGWGAVLPEAIHAKSDFVTLDETFRLDKGILYTNLNVVVLKRKIPANQWKTYLKWTKDAGLTDQVYIQLVRHDTSTTSKSASSQPDSSKADSNASESSSPATSDAQAAKLIQQAYADIGKMDLVNAKDLLDQAARLSPDHEYFWNTSGYLHRRKGEMTEALADFQKELALHPADYQRMAPVIVDVQLQLGDRGAAKDSLRAWEKDDPANPAPVARLLSMLVIDGDAKTVMIEGEAALERMHAEGKEKDETTFMRLSIGQAYLAVGEKQKGADLLRGVLQQSQDAGALNNAAYALADASLELPLAEASSRAALGKLDEESNTWTLDEDPGILLGKTNMIGATWDTLGWTLFHEGKLAEARSYLEAGWLGSPNIENGKHLGDLLASLGDKSAALTTYELAIATEPGYNALGVRTEPSAKVKELQALASTLRREGAKSSTPNVEQKLLALRTVPLGAASGKNGQAEYRLLLKDGKVAKAETSGAKSIPGGDDLVAKATFGGYFPTGTHAALVRFAILNCHSNVCELVLTPSH